MSPASLPQLRVDGAVAVAPYEQIRSQLAAAIASGALPPGTRLPTVRTLAVQLGVAANTVARSYRELEAAGLVETGGRAGTVVSAAGDASREQLVAAAQSFAALAASVGVGRAEAARIVNSVLEQNA